mmetsp:Transcript_12328/g.23947  ORF Transcript_12328/g.23947 Transcript_12328/m.23947 type:complete len:113 (+) Transcript_12328:65-403(+)
MSPATYGRAVASLLLCVYLWVLQLQQLRDLWFAGPLPLARLASKKVNIAALELCKKEVGHEFRPRRGFMSSWVSSLVPWSPAFSWERFSDAQQMVQQAPDTLCVTKGLAKRS